MEIVKFSSTVVSVLRYVDFFLWVYRQYQVIEDKGVVPVVVSVADKEVVPVPVPDRLEGVVNCHIMVGLSTTK